MKINNIKIAKFLSFGPQQELKDFSNFNLFIGKNGSGKTNVFNLLKGLEVDFDFVSLNSLEVDTQIQKHFIYQNNLTNTDLGFYLPSMLMQNYSNRHCFSSDIIGNLEIDYELMLNSKVERKKIRFSDDSRHITQYNEGDINMLKKNVSLLDISNSSIEFHRNFVLFFGKGKNHFLPYLNFALFYIFGIDYRFRDDGTFVQLRKSSGGLLEKDIISLPSGVNNCAKVILQYLMTLGKSIILIDEPELHLEPRVVRNLFQYIVWLNVKDKKNKTTEENNLVKSVEAIIKSNSFVENNTSMWAIIENEKEKTYFDINSTLPQSQIFIASHSSTLINEFLELKEVCKIYEFDSMNLNYNMTEPSGNFNSDGSLEKRTTPTIGFFSVVRNVNTQNSYEILNNLGCRGSDLLQTNGVVWVEGPSDVVYLKKWLEMYCIENNLPILNQGKEYDFQMFGGTLLDSLCILKNENNADLETEEYKKLISMFSFSRNAFVIIDSDSILNANNVIIDKSHFKNAKTYIKNQMESLKNQNVNLGLWFKEGDLEIRTIESYLDDDSVKLKSENNWTKKICAQKITESWTTNKKLSEFKQNLNEEIKVLYEKILEWNK